MKLSSFDMNLIFNAIQVMVKRAERKSVAIVDQRRSKAEETLFICKKK